MQSPTSRAAAGAPEPAATTILHLDKYGSLQAGLGDIKKGIKKFPSRGSISSHFGSHLAPVERQDLGPREVVTANYASNSAEGLLAVDRLSFSDFITIHGQLKLPAAHLRSSPTPEKVGHQAASSGPKAPPSLNAAQ